MNLKALARVSSIFFYSLLCGLLVANPFYSPFEEGSLPSEQGLNAQNLQNGTDELDMPLAKPSFVAPVRSSAPNEQLVVGQLNLRTQLGSYLTQIKEQPESTLLWALLLVAFLYGVLHAFGPGHRKTIVFSYYLTRKAPVWEPAVLSLVLSVLHAGTAIILILLLRGLTGSLAGRADAIGVYLEGFSYIFLALTAFFLVIHALKELFKKSHSPVSHSLSRTMILVSGMYPCPGAILILALSNALQVTGIGILAVLAMSVGMSIPILGAAYLAWFGRTGIFLALKNNEAKIGKIASLLELAGYLFLLAFSIWISLPFIRSLLSVRIF